MANLDKLAALSYNKPVVCEKCGSRDVAYRGIGEYICKNCNFLMYDDYGMVRNYIENNPGVTQAEVSKATGVSKSRIQQMLKEDKIEIAPNSSVFMSCEMCGTEIRSGRYCIHCQLKIDKGARDEKREMRKSAITGGFSSSKTQSTGAKRFSR